MQEQIGIPNVQGATVLQSRPRQIRLTHNDAVLDMYTGTSYRILVGPGRGNVVRPGDYVGQGVHVTTEWLIRNPNSWERIS